MTPSIAEFEIGLPLEIVGFVAGVDPIRRRIATMNDVTGDLGMSSVVGHWTETIDFESGVWTDASTTGAETTGAVDD